MALSKIVGQAELKNLMRVPLLAYQKGHSIGNILLTGPAGNGKTHSASAIAEELKVPFYRIDCASAGKKDLTRTMADASHYSNGFVLNLDELQASVNPTFGNNLLDLLDAEKRQYQINKRGTAETFPRMVVIGTTNEPWRMPKAIDSRFPVMRVRLSTPTDLEIADIMAPRFTKKVPAKMLEAFAMSAGNNARKANGIVSHINLLMELGETFTVESVLTDLAIAYDGAESSHIQILEFLANHQKGEFLGYANQDETARHCRMHKSELKYYVEFLERRDYVCINERSQLEITDVGRQRLEEH